MNEFEKLQHARLIESKQKKCLLCSGVLSQNKTRIKAFYEAMLDKSITIPVIVDVLQSWGVASGPTVIQNHRTGAKSYADHLANIKKAIDG
jgi:hypothetical protein